MKVEPKVRRLNVLRKQLFDLLGVTFCYRFVLVKSVSYLICNQQVAGSNPIASFSNVKRLQ